MLSRAGAASVPNRFALPFVSPDVLAGSISIFALPHLLLLTLPNMILQAGMLDPYVYLGYVDNYADLLDRFGRTYYSTRITYILPEALFGRLFGDEAGYLVLRYLFLAAGSAALFAVARRHASTTTAICASVWFLFNPWILRSLAYFHYDGFAVIYLLVAIALAIAPSRHRRLGAFLGGAVFACAVNCNLFVLAVGALFLPAWLVLERNDRIGRFAMLVGLGVAGFVFAYIALDAALCSAFPSHGCFIEGPAFQTALSMLNGAAAPWFKSLPAYLREGNYHILIPTFIAAAAGAVLLAAPRGEQRARNGRFIAASLIYLGLVSALFLVMQFGVDVSFVADFYYQSYFIPPTSLVVIALFGEVVARAPATLTRAVLPAAGALHILLWLSTQHWLAGATSLTFLPFAAIGMLMVASCLIVHWRADSAMIAVSSFMLVAPFAYYAAPDTGPSSPRALRLHSSEQAVRERDVLAGARFLERVVSRLDPGAGNVGFWYGSKDAGFNSIQSTYLWQYSRVFSSSGPGLPVVDESFRRLVADKRFLVLLAYSAAEIETATDGIRKADFRVETVDEQVFQGRAWGYRLAILELLPPKRDIGRVITHIPLSAVSAISEEPVLMGEDEVTVVTPRSQWAYSAMFPLPAEVRTAGRPLIVHLRLTVETGSIGIGIAAVDHPERFLNEISVYPSALPVRDVYVDLTEAAAAGSVILRNWSAKGESRVNILSIEIGDPAEAHATTTM